MRDHLIAEAVDFRAMCSKTLEGHKIENGETVWEHLSHKVDALLEGKAITFHRFELPRNHPMAPPHGGDPNDLLQIGEDDVVREVQREFWRRPGLTAGPIAPRVATAKSPRY